jgi:hypothetical protein
MGMQVEIVIMNFKNIYSKMFHLAYTGYSYYEIRKKFLELLPLGVGGG